MGLSPTTAIQTELLVGNLPNTVQSSRFLQAASEGAAAFGSQAPSLPMSAPQPFILGEFRRTLDERYRLSIPSELADILGSEGNGCFLAKERLGCLSLWSGQHWKEKLDAGVDLILRKMQAGKLEGKVTQVQMLGRLLSTRHRPVELAGRGRLVVPEGFREFLGVEPGGEVLIVGAAVCVEIWNPPAWFKYVGGRMPKFRRLFDQLSS